MLRPTLACLVLFVVSAAAAPAPGSAIFLHPDGSGLAMWNALRIIDRGPHGLTEWDRLPRVALYRGHLADQIGATSNAGATIHAYGRKVGKKAFGMDGGERITSASGFDGSLMHEAQERKLAVGLVQSGQSSEPGTAAFLARVEDRKDTDAITQQLIASGANVLLGAGESEFLPPTKTGRHGAPGKRKDGKDLVAEAEAAGYTVVYTLDELRALPATTPKVLGLFAAEATYHDKDEATLAEAGLPLYVKDAPTVAEMTTEALRFLSAGGRRFFLVVEEEGTDNFANHQNAAGTLEALRRADAAIAVARAFVAAHPQTLLLVAADSDASGFTLVDAGPFTAAAKKEKLATPLPPTTELGAPLDGQGGPGTEPFLTAPDAAGRRFPVAVSWITKQDNFGAVVARADGYRADELPLHLDNTAVYAFLRAVLFGQPFTPGPGGD